MIDQQGPRGRPRPGAERIVCQVVCDACRQAAALIGPGHPRFAAFERAAALLEPPAREGYDGPPRLRLVTL